MKTCAHQKETGGAETPPLRIGACLIHRNTHPHVFSRRVWSVCGQTVSEWVSISS